MENSRTGTLYIVATPIGNSKDISPRARKILEDADLIAAEDTRRSVILLNKLEISNRLVSNHKFNEYGKSEWFIEQLMEGRSVAVITDAGTPCISDPGNALIRAAYQAGIAVKGIPGCCAAVNALAISGFDLSSFSFHGFFPRENAERKRMLNAMRQNTTAKTFAFYESPKRIMSLVDFFIEEHADCTLFLINDMTKLHEKSYRGNPQEVKDLLLEKGNYEKGEYTLVVELSDAYRYKKQEHIVSPEAMLVDAMVSGADIREAITAVLNNQNNSYSKNELKAAAIRLKNIFSPEQSGLPQYE